MTAVLSPAGGTNVVNLPSARSPLAHRRLDLQQAMAHADDPLPYRVYPIAVDGCCTVIPGASGIGKTILTTGFAKGVQLGIDTGGMTCTAGGVAIFDAENGERLTGRRLRAMDVPDIDLHIYEATGLDLRNEQHVDAIVDEIVERGSKLVIFDSLRQLTPGAGENDSDDMAKSAGNATKIARRTNSAVMLIHHRGKDDSSDYRGSTAIKDQVDLMFVLEAVGKEPKPGHLRLRCAKYRIDVVPPPQWIEIASRDGTLGVHAAGAPGIRLPRPARNQVTTDVLSAVQVDGPLSGAAIAKTLGRDKTDGTVRRALQELVIAGDLQKTDTGYRVANGHPATPGNPGNGAPSEGVANGAISRRDGTLATQEHPGVAT
jgi:hypothetical protein